MKKIIVFAVVVFLAIGCNKNSQPGTAQKNTVTNLTVDIFTKTKPQNAISVVETRKLKAGTEVTVFGTILGSKIPFVKGRASFVIGDPAKLTVCKDQCKKPWDCCCDDKKVIAASTLSIQVVDKKGNVLKTNLKGQGGLKELSKVIVQGKIDTSSSANFMVINAKNIYVE